MSWVNGNDNSITIQHVDSELNNYSTAAEDRQIGNNGRKDDHAAL